MGTKTQNINFIDRVNLLIKYSVDKTIDENAISKVQKSYFGPKKTFEKMMNEQGGVPGAGVSDWPYGYSRRGLGLADTGSTFWLCRFAGRDCAYGHDSAQLGHLD